jgi:hypothetical protein
VKVVEKSAADKNFERRMHLAKEINATHDIIGAYIPFALEAGLDRLAQLLANESAVMSRHTQSVGELESGLAFARGIQQAAYAVLGDLPPQIMSSIRAKWYRVS